ncbi:hypothetical protein EOA91_27905, partial [Mesorhizobium sp. M1A.F.Ca.IN.022.04.1.1]
MDQEQPQHEKIRFRRDEITDLGAFPSACSVPPLGRASVRRRFRILGRVFAGLCALVLLAAIGVYVLGTSGIGTERLRAEAETAIEKLAGVDLNITVGPARLTLDGSSFVALQVSDVSLKTADGKPMADVGRVRFGMRLLPLLSGEVKLTSARFSDARIMVAAMPSGSGDWTAALRNEDGLVDPEKVSAAVFGGVNAALDAVRAESMRQIDLRNVEFELPPGGSVRRLTVAQATVGQTGTGSMELSSKADVDGRHVSLSASAARDPSARRIASLDAAVAIADVGVTPAQGSSSGGNFAAQGGKLGSVALKLSGVEASGDTPSRLTASLSLGGSVLDLGSRGLLPADVDARATLVAGSNKVSVDKLLIRTGRSTFDFSGSVGP